MRDNIQMKRFTAKEGHGHTERSDALECDNNLSSPYKSFETVQVKLIWEMIYICCSLFIELRFIIDSILLERDPKI